MLETIYFYEWGVVARVVLMKFRSLLRTGKPVCFARRTEPSASRVAAGGLLATGFTTAPHAPPPIAKTPQSSITPGKALEKLIDSRRLGRVAGIYDLDSGKIQFFNR